MQLIAVQLLIQGVVAVCGAAILLVSPHPAPVEAQPTQLSGFIEAVRRDINSFWSDVARYERFTYSPPALHLIQPGIAVKNACDVAAGNHHRYCTRERTVYLDIGFQRLSSLGGLWNARRDTSIVQIMAHEMAHHVQFLVGAYRRGLQPIQIELQADCLSGAFLRWADLQGRMDPGDLEEARWIAGNSPNPMHGTGQQRVDSLMRGYVTYSFAAC